MAKTSNDHQRVGVFVDVQNMYYSAMNLYEKKVDFDKILKDAVGNRKLIRAFAYVIKADMQDEDSFFEALENIGFEVRSKNLQVFYGGSKKGDWDVGIAMDAIRLSSKLDTIVLVSGDGDFVDLVQYLKSHGVRVEVMAFGKSASQKLREECDRFYEMDGKRRYLRAKRSPRGKNPRDGARSKSGDIGGKSPE